MLLLRLTPETIQSAWETRLIPTRSGQMLLCWFPQLRVEERQSLSLGMGDGNEGRILVNDWRNGDGILEMDMPVARLLLVEL